MVLSRNRASCFYQGQYLFCYCSRGFVHGAEERLEHDQGEVNDLLDPRLERYGRFQGFSSQVRASGYPRVLAFLLPGYVSIEISLLIGVKLPYFIKYGAHFFTLKMMLKYSLHNMHGR